MSERLLARVPELTDEWRKLFEPVAAQAHNFVDRLPGVAGGAGAQPAKSDHALGEEIEFVRDGLIRYSQRAGNAGVKPRR